MSVLEGAALAAGGVLVLMFVALFVVGAVRFRRAAARGGGVGGVFMQEDRVQGHQAIHEAEAAASARLAYVFAMWGMSDLQPVDKAEVDRAMDSDAVRSLADQEGWVVVAAGDVAVLARDLIVELTGMPAVMVADMLVSRAAAAAGLAADDAPAGIESFR